MNFLGFKLVAKMCVDVPFDVAFFVALPVEFYQLVGAVIHSGFTASAVRARL